MIFFVKVINTPAGITDLIGQEGIFKNIHP